MRNQVVRTLALAAGLLSLAGTAQAQGHSHDHEPPGLAKKPGGMPPGQAKKVYNTADGADALSTLLRERGYTVTRVVPGTHDTRYVYYRLHKGREQRAVIRPGTARPAFTNVPSSLMRELMTRLR